jgi:dynein heavy chain
MKDDVSEIMMPDDAAEEIDPDVANACEGHPLDDGTYDPDMIPGIETGDHIVEFFAKYGQASAVKFFYCNR